MDKLSEVLNLRECGQDWDIELADPDRVEEFCQLYSQLHDEDERFTLMTLIIASLDDNREPSASGVDALQDVNPTR